MLMGWTNLFDPFDYQNFPYSVKTALCFKNLSFRGLLGHSHSFLLDETEVWVAGNRRFIKVLKYNLFLLGHQHNFIAYL